MKIIKQFFWILLFSLLGEGISLALESFVVIPGSVIGMLLLFAALHFNFLAMEKVDELATWLTDNMAIFFVPAGVGLMVHFDLLAEFYLELTVILILTVSILMIFVGKLMEKLLAISSSEKLDEKGVKADD